MTGGIRRTGRARRIVTGVAAAVLSVGAVAGCGGGSEGAVAEAFARTLKGAGIG
ncbi:hypothetical protein ABT234_18485 [Streptomyces sp. NPDC001586]|uniref:hypothetical protein n=1 Tax=Streptomyces sp. NPDC001586 TaxID=3154387 RepID=UPI00332F30A9